MNIFNGIGTLKKSVIKKTTRDIWGMSEEQWGSVG